MKLNSKLSAAFSIIVFAAISGAYSKQVTIQPILVADTNGTNLSPQLSYDAYLTKIYAQADIGVTILAANFLNDSTYNHWNYNNSNAMVNSAGHGQNANNLIINAWFVDEVLNASVYGFGYLDAPFMVMDTTNIAGFSALGRVDTFAHELGHVLNLDHYDSTNPGDPNKADHLMASGGIRNIPQALGDVAPDGQGWDLIGQSEIDVMRRSKFAIDTVPEPGTFLAVGLGIAVLARRKRRA